MHSRFLFAVAALLVTAPTSATTRYIVRFADVTTAEAASQPAPRRSRRDTAEHGQPRYVATLGTGARVFDIEDDNPAHFARLRGVVSVEEDRIIRAAALPDPLYPRQWYLHDARMGVDAEVAWKYTRGDGAVVPVLDSGSTPHRELDGQLLPGYDFISSADAARDGDGRDADPTDEGDWQDPGDCGRKTGSASSWHGTHVMGLVAARRGNQLGIVGMAPEAKVLPVRVLGRCGGHVSDLLDAIAWASGGVVPGVSPAGRRADVINLSLSTAGQCGAALQDAVNQARARGTLVVAAAGNDGVDASLVSPANCAGVISVAALDRLGWQAWYSNFGTGISLAAPGGSLRGVRWDDMVSSVDQGSRGRFRGVFGYQAGTSMAAPLVSGTLALMRSLNPSLGVEEATELLKDTARPALCPKGCGSGLLDAGAALDAVATER